MPSPGLPTGCSSGTAHEERSWRWGRAPVPRQLSSVSCSCHCGTRTCHRAHHPPGQQLRDRGMGLGEDRSPGWPPARLRQEAREAAQGDPVLCMQGPQATGLHGHQCLALATHAPQGCLKDKGQGPAELCQRPGRVPGTAQCPGGLRLQTPTTASSYAATLKTGRSQDGFLSGFCSARSRRPLQGPPAPVGTHLPPG